MSVFRTGAHTNAITLRPAHTTRWLYEKKCGLTEMLVALELRPSGGSALPYALPPLFALSLETG